MHQKRLHKPAELRSPWSQTEEKHHSVSANY